MSQPEPIWTVPRVQSMAQTAVTIELYTLPFYLTALTSIQDTTSLIYANILSVSMEEMLHMELAANLCLALGTTPDFTAPIFGNPIPFLDPDDPETNHYALLNAVLGPFDETRLGTMLDIETPEEFEENTSYATPNAVYGSIGQFYDALLQGITAVGWDKFGGSTTNQQAQFNAPDALLTIGSFPEKIARLEDAQTAIATITEQGEGKAMSPVPQPPFTIDQFPIPLEYQLTGEPFDPSGLNAFSHFGRFVDIQNTVASETFPDVYAVGLAGPLNFDQVMAQTKLQEDFALLIAYLNEMWTGTQVDYPTWSAPMFAVLDDAVACWKAGVIPMWSPAQASVTP